MALKISRGIWFVSTLAVLAALLTVYAGLPDEVFLFQQGLDYISLTREMVFYLALAIITLVNALVYIVGALFQKEEGFRAWFHLLVVTLNIFFAVTLFFLNVYNSTEKFDFQRIGFLVYGSVILVALCALFWPIYTVVRKFLHKPTVYM